jgi:hypothetical protein
VEEEENEEAKDEENEEAKDEACVSDVKKVRRRRRKEFEGARKGAKSRKTRTRGTDEGRNVVTLVDLSMQRSYQLGRPGDVARFIAHLQILTAHFRAVAAALVDA